MTAYEITRLSEVATCMDALDIDKLRRLPKIKRTIICDGAPVERTFAPVRLGQRDLLADTVTGSLYNPKTGRCLSSDRLRLEQ